MRWTGRGRMCCRVARSCWKVLSQHGETMKKTEIERQHGKRRDGRCQLLLAEGIISGSVPPTSMRPPQP